MKKLLLILLCTLSLNSAHADQLTVGLLGVTVHGLRVNKESANKMPRKIMQNGVMVWHPELNVSYRRNLFVYNLTFLSDCFGNFGGFAGMGPSWDLFDHFINLSLPVGIYVRKNPGDEYDLPQWIRHGQIDTIPVMWISLQKDFAITENWKIAVQIASNYYLNHGFLGFTYGGGK